jgi:hypothetical protein
MQFAMNSTETTTVTRVRFRSTMCVPPCEAGVKPMPPMPASRPECIMISPISASEKITWRTARNWSISATGYQRGTLRYLEGDDDVRGRIRKLLVTGDNRLKQGVSADKARESYEQALALAEEAGLEEQVRPLVEVRLADLERLAAGSPPPEPPAA